MDLTLAAPFAYGVITHDRSEKLKPTLGFLCSLALQGGQVAIVSYTA